ncbi:MAG: hypothetical protein WAT36_08730 [Chromatiaceae bacterium]
MTDPSDHWAQVYAACATHEASWYQIRPETSLKLIANLGIQPDDAVIDVGGGASNLVDHLLEQGFTDVTVLDISTATLSAVPCHPGSRGAEIHLWGFSPLLTACCQPIGRNAKLLRM